MDQNRLVKLANNPEFALLLTVIVLFVISGIFFFKDMPLGLAAMAASALVTVIVAVQLRRASKEEELNLPK